MATEQEKLIVTLEANIRQYLSSIKKLEDANKKMFRSLKQEIDRGSRANEAAMGRMGRNMGTSFVRGLRSTVSALAIGQIVREAIRMAGNEMDRAQKLLMQARGLGLRPERLQQLIAGGRAQGIPTEDIIRGLEEINRQRLDPKSLLSELFRLNKVEPRNLEKALIALSNIMKNAPKEADLARLMREITGSEELTTFFASGGEAIFNYGKVAEYTTKQLEEMAKALEVARRAEEKLEKGVGGFFRWLFPAFHGGGGGPPGTTPGATVPISPDVTDLGEHGLTVNEAAKESSLFLLRRDAAEEANAQTEERLRHLAAEAQAERDLGEAIRERIIVQQEEQPTVQPTVSDGGGGGLTVDVQPESEITTEEEVERRKKAAEAAHDHAEAIAQVLSALQKELILLQMSERQQLIQTSLWEANTTAVTDAGRAISDMAGRLYDARLAAEQMQEIGGALSSAISGFVGDIMNGVDATEALRNALMSLGQQLMDMMLNQLFSGLFGGGGLGGMLAGGIGGIGGGAPAMAPGAALQASRMIGMNGQALKGTPHTITVGGAMTTSINVQGDANEKTLLTVARMIETNNQVQRSALQRDWGRLSQRYRSLRG